MNSHISTTVASVCFQKKNFASSEQDRVGSSIFIYFAMAYVAPRWLSGEESTCQRTRGGSDPWIRKIPWGRKGQHSSILAQEIPLQYSRLGNPTPVLSPGKSHSSTLAREIPLQYSCPGNPTPVFLPGKSHSSILAREIPWTEDPGGLQSRRSRRAGHDLATKQQPWPMWEKNKQVDICGYMWIYKGSLCVTWN